MSTPTDTPSIEPLLVRAEDIPALLGHPKMCRATIHKLRRLGQWPRLMFIGGRLFAKRSDVELFIEQQLAEYDEQHAKAQAIGRRAVAVRYGKTPTPEPAP